MSNRREATDAAWSSRWERRQAWTATFGNRSDLPWPYSSTPIRHAVGEPPALSTQLGEVFAEAVDSTSGLLMLAAALLATVNLAVLTLIAGGLADPLQRVAAVTYALGLIAAGTLQAVANLAPATSPRARRLARPGLAAAIALVATAIGLTGALAAPAAAVTGLDLGLLLGGGALYALAAGLARAATRAWLPRAVAVAGAALHAIVILHLCTPVA